MKRKTFDLLASIGGGLVVVVLLVAGTLLLVGYNFANNNVHNQLAEQQITFPPAAAFAHPVSRHARSRPRWLARSARTPASSW